MFATLDLPECSLCACRSSESDIRRFLQRGGRARFHLLHVQQTFVQMHCKLKNVPCPNFFPHGVALISKADGP